MGSGASRNNKPSKESSRRGVQWPQDGSNQDEFKRKRSEVKSHQRLEKAGKLPQLPMNRKIVGLEESDDDADGKRILEIKRHNLKTRSYLKEQEDKINKDLNELEKTLRSLEEDEKRRGNCNRTRKQETQSALTSTKRKPNDDLNSGSCLSSTSSGFPRNVPEISNRQKAGQAQWSSCRPTLTKTLKFSWDEQPSLLKDKTSDEWTYKQTVINGFDPDKFRRANLSGIDNDLKIDRRVYSPPISTINIPMNMPGVPTYDQTEKQLLASLEHELGVQ